MPHALHATIWTQFHLNLPELISPNQENGSIPPGLLGLSGQLHILIHKEFWRAENGLYLFSAHPNSHPLRTRFEIWAPNQDVTTHCTEERGQQENNH